MASVEMLEDAMTDHLREQYTSMVARQKETSRSAFGGVEGVVLFGGQRLLYVGLRINQLVRHGYLKWRFHVPYMRCMYTQSTYIHPVRPQKSDMQILQ